MNKFCKLFIAVLAVAAPGAAAFAQGNHYNMHPQTPKHAWQEKVSSQAVPHDCWKSLKMGICGEWSSTQEAAKKYHDTLVQKIKANPEKYFHRDKSIAYLDLPDPQQIYGEYYYRKPTLDELRTSKKQMVSAQQKASSQHMERQLSEAEYEARQQELWKKDFLKRYTRLQELIDANVWVFPQYVLYHGLDLTRLDNATMAELEKIFKGTNSENTPRYSYKEVVVKPYNYEGVSLDVNDKVKLLIYVSPDMTQRRIDISWK